MAFTPAEPVEASVAIAVDVLRASSTICAALAGGFECVACTTEPEDARALAADGARLAGERECVRIDGFDFGNSPAELAAAPGGGRLALTTTNGTRLLVAASSRCDRVYVGALANLDAVATAVRELAPASVVVLCAGVEGAFAIDDAYCAGRLVQELGGERDDSAVAAATLATTFGSAREALDASASAANLRRVGLDADVEWCAVESRLDVVPVVTERAPEIVLVADEAATLRAAPGA